MVELISTIVKALVDHPEDVTVKVIEGDRKITYQLSVHQEDTGKVIGKQGRVARAIRTVVYAAGVNLDKKIHLEIL
ncbi:KH domain-containing protein [Bacillus marinisedimentorum]|uniref:KH domain-containing protein n=1 Tax=Bacillus marinisedimentorum TaxID=1821260 RepID=UPI0007DFBB9D|nr:KH domain-containing protein [Bacillus marinisedimentorum]